MFLPKPLPLLALSAALLAQALGVTAPAGASPPSPFGPTQGANFPPAAYVAASNLVTVDLNSTQVLTPAQAQLDAPMPSSCPSPYYLAEYFNNLYLSGTPAFTRCETINFNWGAGGPGNGIGTDNFSVRWTGRIYLSAGTYTSIATADDGIRVWLDNIPVINAWQDQGYTEYRASREVATTGYHTFRIEYYEHGGQAAAAFRWVSGVSCPTISGWQAKYWGNSSMAGTPFTCRNDPDINFNWGTGSPVYGLPALPADAFSAQWTRSIYFSPGRYRFHLAGDDGVRLWIDGAPVIDEWRDQGYTAYSGDRTWSTGGTHGFRVEYYENTGGAAVRLWWEPAPADKLVVSNRQFFDKCEAPTTAEMQTWWDESPYWEANIYIGGVMRACGQANLNATWVATVRAQGWNLVPTWVGPQAPCSGYGARISADPNQAYGQGRAEAGAAATTAQALGLTSSGQGGTIIYYDMEGYGNDANCRAAVKSFIAGWVDRLHELGNRAGVYGSACASYVSDWAALSAPPDDVWPAAWNYSSYNVYASVWNVPCVDNMYWVNHQRLRQYAGGHNEVWGGLTFNIDSNIADGHVAGTNGRGVAGPVSSPEGTTQLEMQSLAVPDFQLLPTGEGWAIANNRFFWSMDGGRTWADRTPLQLEAEANLRAGFFKDAQTGWLLLATPTLKGAAPSLSVARTTDGGATWVFASLGFTPLDPNTLASSMWLNFVDAKVGWVAIELASGTNFSLGALFSTVDGGQTWEERTLPLGAPVTFVDAQSGWVAGGVNQSELYLTRDGGRSWEAQKVAGMPTAAQAVYHLPIFKDNTTGLLPIMVFAAGQSRVELYRTQDGGTHWDLSETLVVPDTATTSMFWQSDGLQWLAAISDQTLLHSLAATSLQDLGFVALPNGTTQVAFASPRVGWAMVTAGQCTGEKSDAGLQKCQLENQLRYTLDGGRNWEMIWP